MADLNALKASERKDIMMTLFLMLIGCCAASFLASEAARVVRFRHGEALMWFAIFTWLAIGSLCRWQQSSNKSSYYLACCIVSL
jgi:hypothetical protein